MGLYSFFLIRFKHYLIHEKAAFTTNPMKWVYMQGGLQWDYYLTHQLIPRRFRRGLLFFSDFHIISSARALIVKITVLHCLVFDTNVFVPASLSVLTDFFLCRLVFSLRY